MTYNGPTEFPVTRLVSVYDGDTWRCEVELGFHVHTTILCRLKGWDCPERKSSARPLSEWETSRADAARTWTEAWFTAALAGGGVHLTTGPDPETWNRWLAVPFTWPDRQPLGASLQAQGLAVPWKRAGDPRWYEAHAAEISAAG